MTPAPDSSEVIDHGDTDWRAALLSRLGIVVVVLLALGGAVSLIGSDRSDLVRAFALVVLGSSFILFGVLSFRQISPRIKSIVIIAILAAVSVVSYSIGGYLPGGPLIAAYVLVLAALLVGRNSFVILLLAFSVLVITLTVLIATDTWQGPQFNDIDPADPWNWIRTSLTSLIMWTSFSFSVMFVVNTIEENLDRRRIALNRLRDEVNERRAAELAQREAEEKANQAQKMEVVGQLAAGIAQDFNNELLVIKGWNEIRGSSDVTDEQRQATAAIEQAVDHTTQLSGQLLTFARKDVHTPKYVVLGKLVEAAVNSLQHIAGANIKLNSDVQTEAIVHVDEPQLQQMMFNLVINARDAISGEGKIEVLVRMATASDVVSFPGEADDWVVLEVADDGPGIDEEDQVRVFEPFFTTKPPGEGAGLGLSTVHGIVKQSGGHVSLQSRPGQTVFSILLPSVSNEHYEESVVADGDTVVDVGMRILVIEDNPLVRKLIVSAIQKTGYETEECDNGDAALSLLRDDETTFDLLCVDAVFPGAPLIDVVTAFERHSPDAKVLVCSGYVQEEIAIRKLESGEYAFLAKPFTVSQLMQKVHEVVGSRQLAE
ncbi:MAG: ATP-binding protein [Woeseiaceae bacterium]